MEIKFSMFEMLADFAEYSPDNVGGSGRYKGGFYKNPALTSRGVSGVRITGSATSLSGVVDPWVDSPKPTASKRMQNLLATARTKSASAGMPGVLLPSPPDPRIKAKADDVQTIVDDNKPKPSKALVAVKVQGKNGNFFRRQLTLIRKHPKQAALIAGGSLLVAGGAKVLSDNLSTDKKMGKSNFSMSEFQSAWERDADNPEMMAYFAANSSDWMPPKKSGLRNALGNVGKEIGKKAGAAKNKVAVLVKNANGNAFIQQRWKNIQDAGGAIKANPGKSATIAAGVLAVGGGLGYLASKREPVSDAQLKRQAFGQYKQGSPRLLEKAVVIPNRKTQSNPY